MNMKVKVSTEDLILSLIRDKIYLTKINDEKDRVINSLTKKLNKYERKIEDAR